MVTPEEDRYKYDLPDKMANYSKNPLRTLMSRKPFYWKILQSNIVPTKTLDDFVKDILKQRHEQEDMAIDT